MTDNETNFEKNDKLTKTSYDCFENLVPVEEGLEVSRDTSEKRDYVYLLYRP